HRVPRALAAATAVLLIVATLATGVYTLRDEVVDIVANVPVAAQRIRQRLSDGRKDRDSAFQQVQRAAKEIEKTAQVATQPETPAAPGNVQRVEVVEPAFKATDYIWMGGVGFVGFLGQFAVILFLVYFFLVTGDLYKRKLVKIAGPKLSQKKITV